MIRAKNRKTFGKAPKVGKHLRRKPIEGEDMPALKIIMKDIEGQSITVEDFILLVAPHTGDKGAALTKVMTADINSFRRFVNEAYDTMTSDTNEVMAKTQMELSQLYCEKHHILINNMIKFMKQIQDYIVDFDLHQYNQDSERYLASHFKIADIPDEEEVEQARRQLAYHRLNWLKSEGDRLGTENSKLQKRLNELKTVQQAEIAETIKKEREAEAQRIALEKQQAEMERRLKGLTEELHDSIVAEEENVTQTRIDGQNQAIKKKVVKKKAGKTPAKTAKTKDSDWSTKAAQELETEKLKKTSSSQSTLVKEAIKKKSASRFKGMKAFSSTAEPPEEAASSTRQAGGKKTKKGKLVKQRPVWQDVNLEEFDVPPPPDAPPPKSQCAPTCPASPKQQASSSRQAPAFQPTSRRGYGPQDTWGGFD